MIRKRAVGIAILSFSLSAAWGGAELTLIDGTVLSGAALERTREGIYLLTRGDGEVVTIPVELVKKLRLTAGDDPAPTAFKVAQGKTLVGVEIDPPKARDQLAAFGRPPAEFRRGFVNVDWNPESALGPDVSSFHPVRWARSPTDPVWAPTSAFRSSKDVTQFSPVRWYQAATDATWHPSMGFRPASKWFSVEWEQK